ncbi:MAG: hypothetical protein JO157_00010 [Acetobacteraceae bacterium]|nr:hypothetical protein [Acetobacteraceae bacterium]
MRLAPGVPTDLAGTAPPGLGTPRPVPIVSTFDGAYEGALAPDPSNQPACGATPYGLARTMLVANGHATLGVNLPFEGTVEPDGFVAMHYLNVGTINGRFAGGAFAGVLRAGEARACRWAVGLAKVVPQRPAPAAEVPLAPGLVPQGLSPGAAGLPSDTLEHPPNTGACAPASLENCR